MGLRGRRGILGWAWGAMALAAIGLGGCHSNTTQNLPVITTQPTNQTVTVGQTATFSVVATGTGPLMYQWYVNGVVITGATSASYTTPVTVIGNNGAFVFVLVINSFGSVESAEVGLTVNGTTSSSSGSVVRVGTLRNDPQRSGENTSEPILSPGNVSAQTFGKTGFLATDAAVDAQPLYMGGVNVPSAGARNIVYAATEANSVYAFDEATGAAVWRANLNGAGETPGDSLACDAAGPEIGISSTPVIDPTRGTHGAIYVVAMTKNAAGEYTLRMHELDAATGAEIAGSPVAIAPAAANSNGRAALNSRAGAASSSLIVARGGLLLAGGRVYVGLSPLCANAGNASGWIVAIDGASLRQTGAVPFGAGSGETLTADSAENIFAAGGNAALQAASTSGGNSLVRITGTNALAIADMSRPMGNSGGAVSTTVLLPDRPDASGRVWHLAATADASGDLFVLNRDSLNGNSASGALEQIAGAFEATGATADLAYFNGNLFVAAPGNRVKAFAVSDARIGSVPIGESVSAIAGSSANISVSGAGAANGIVWVVESGQTAMLRAFDAGNLASEIYNSAQAAQNRDAIQGASGVPATVANGRVYVATQTGVAVFGLVK
jgi:hypothetical protein